MTTLFAPGNSATSSWVQTLSWRAVELIARICGKQNPLHNIQFEAEKLEDDLNSLDNLERGLMRLNFVINEEEENWIC
jgi:hypothetical protein